MEALFVSCSSGVNLSWPGEGILAFLPLALALSLCLSLPLALRLNNYLQCRHAQQWIDEVDHPHGAVGKLIEYGTATMLIEEESQQQGNAEEQDDKQRDESDEEEPPEVIHVAKHAICDGSITS